MPNINLRRSDTPTSTIQKVKMLLATEAVAQIEVAAATGMKVGMVSKIARGESWADIEPPAGAVLVRCAACARWILDPPDACIYHVIANEYYCSEVCERRR
jgi:hypothetical protein